MKRKLGKKKKKGNSTKPQKSNTEAEVYNNHKMCN